MTTIICKNAVFSSRTADAFDIQSFINEFFSLIPEGVELSADTLSDKLSPRAFLSEIISALSGGSSAIISFLSLLIIWVILAFLSENFLSDGQKSAPMISLIFALPTLEVLSKIALSLITSLEKLAVFFTSVIPLLSLISLSSGAPTAARTQGLQMTVTSAVISGLAVKILLPLGIAMLAFSAAASLEGSFCSRLVNAAKTIFTKVFGTLSLVVGMLFSLQSLIATSADTAAIRMAKFSAQSMLPQIGGLVSSSLSALGAGLSYAKGIIGAGAIYVILIIFLSPLPMLLAYRLCLSLAESLSKALGTGSATATLTAFISAMDSLLSVYALVTLLSLLEIILFIRAAVPIA